jgi:hypothetical protein
MTKSRSTKSKMKGDFRENRGEKSIYAVQSNLSDFYNFISIFISL